MGELKQQDWSHQPIATKYLLDHENAMLDIRMGGGKTKIVIDAMREVSSEGRQHSFLTFCPAPVIGTWLGQLSQHAHEHFDVVLMNGSGNSTDKAQRIVDGFLRLQCGGRPLVVVVNYDLFWRPNILSLLNSRVWTGIIADESHRLKSHSAKCSKEAWKLAPKARRRIGMTGTIMPHSPMDIFGQYRFLNDRIFGRYMTNFRNQYAIMNPYIQGAIKEWINQDDMYRKIDLIRHSVTGDFLVLPEKQDIIYEVPLSPGGMRVYQQMKKDYVAELRKVCDDGEESFTNAIASNGAVKFLRLLQLAQGYVGDEDGNEVETDTQKRKVLLELLEDLNEPVVVYGWFKHDLAVIEKCCEILGKKYGELSGRRKDLTVHSKMPEDIDVLGVQCKSGSSGIDLTRSSIGIIMNSGMLSPGDYDQMMARQYRPGQTRNMRFIHLVSPKTVDETIRKARSERRDIVDAILKSGEFF